MALNIRLSPALDLLARDYCERVGISLNSLVGVALDAYLRQPQPLKPAAPESVAAAFVPAVIEPALAAKRDALHELQASQRVKPVLAAAPLVQSSAMDDPKPILSAKPSKAERSKLAAWHQRNK